jgi:endoglucanase
MAPATLPTVRRRRAATRAGDFWRDLAAAATALTLGLATPLSTHAQTTPPGLDPFDQVREMGGGLNVLGYDPLWTDPAKAHFQPRHFKIIREGGFRTVRINLQAFSHMLPSGKMDPKWLATLDRMVDAALSQHLTVILDEHDFNFCAQQPTDCRVLLTAFWREIGAHYAGAPNQVLFEILNEPNGKLDDTAWNRLLALELAEIRKTNPTRNVIVGPAFWNSTQHLGFLELPADDRHLIVTVHYYTPMEFTHQGASWTQYVKLSGVHWGSPAEVAQIDHDFDGVQAWAKDHHRPIFLGEFGAYDKGDMASRVRYTSAVARAAEKRGWAWAYWQFDSDFIAWDMGRNAWVEPIHKALVP